MDLHKTECFHKIEPRKFNSEGVDTNKPRMDERGYSKQKNTRDWKTETNIQINFTLNGLKIVLRGKAILQF